MLQNKPVFQRFKPEQTNMKSKYNRTLIMLLASLLFALFGAGCGTIRGIGNDVETVGEGVQDATR